MAIDLSAAWVTDGEFYGNYSLIGFKSINTQKVISRELFEPDEYLSKEDREFIRDFMKSKTTVGFYSNNFDLTVYSAALEGADCRELKKITNVLIVDGMKPWDVADDFEFNLMRHVPHIDLIEVAPGQASLKIYNGRLHGRRMQDLPYDPDVMLTDDEKEQVYQYWKNDLAATELLFKSLTNELQLRAAMSAEYRTDLMSKSDAQIAEAVMKAEIEKITGYRPEKPKKVERRFFYDIPKYIDFKGHDQLESLLDWLWDNEFQVKNTGKVDLPEELLVPIVIGGREYQMGIGGLHSKESRQHVRSDNQYILVDRDVESYYPRIILNQGVFPIHLGPVFLKVYGRIVNRRISEKKEAGKLKKLRDAELKGSTSWDAINVQWLEHQKNSDSLKITINGLFGKLGNKYSIVYSPKLLIQTTVTGQLTLLLFIWMIHKSDLDAEVVSANTDGIVIRCARDDEERLAELVAEFETLTNFKTEETRYEHLYSADVNNYIAIKEDGGVKTKGRFAIAEPGKPPLMQKNPTGEIVVTAVIDHITKGVPLTRTIRNCTDITKFLTVRTVQGGGLWSDSHEHVKQTVKHGWQTAELPEPGVIPSKPVYLGKAIRWYYAKGLDTAIYSKKPNVKGNHNTVAKSEGARPYMELRDDFPDDIDIARYVKEANQVLREIAFHEEEV